MTAPATVADFKVRFDRDFIFGAGKETVRDSDIQTALDEANAIFNTDLWVDVAERKTAYLYASAHLMVQNVQMAGGLAAKTTGLGIQNRGGGWVSSKNVAQVSVQYGIPQSILESPILNQFMRTDYGLRYLQLIAGRLVGHVQVVCGWNDTGGPNANT